MEYVLNLEFSHQGKYIGIALKDSISWAEMFFNSSILDDSGWNRL